MPEYSPHQKRIIDRYYDRHDDIMLAKIQELIPELFLAETEKKRDRLWERVRTAMENLKVAPGIMEHILNGRDPKVLAANLQDWLKARN